MTNLKMAKTSNQEWEARGALALKFGATMSVLALVGVIAAHAPRDMHELTNAPAAVTAPADTATPSSKPAYYFPSEYQLNAPAEEVEPAPTF